MTSSPITIATHDGEQLAGTLYLPETEGRFAALLEALPYRKDDVTASYSRTYERYVAAGFAVLRLDLRGTGSSTGSMQDEYADVERRDLRSAIRWLANQQWSNSKVGMFGTSYSGFNSLHMALEGIPELGAIVAIYATDDRYTDDVHYCGGVLRALDLIDYPLYMVAMNALPPVPAVFGDGYGEEWHRRIDQTRPWMLPWIAERHDTKFWRRGSVRLGPGGQGYERISCPTMLIAGWADGYRNNTFRTVAELQRNATPWRLIAGPWVHKPPATALPGPNIDEDAEIIAFFDEHLRGGPRSPGAPGQVYIRATTEPEPDLRHHPGRWVDLQTWPPQSLGLRTLRTELKGIETHVVAGDVGIAAWNSCGGGLPWGQPLDQWSDNARSITYDWPVTSPADLVGNPSVSVRVRSDQNYGHLSVKLCDVFPDGRSTLITRGMLDLTHIGRWPADPHGVVGATPAAIKPGEWLEPTIEFEATTWTLEPGHTLRLALAGTDWPNCWPPPGPVTLQVDSESVLLNLPVLEGAPTSTHAFIRTPPRTDEGLRKESEGVEWRIGRDVLARETSVRTRYGGTYEGTHGAVITDDYCGELGVSTLNPANAWARGSARFEVCWPEMKATTEARLSIESTAERFSITIEVDVWRDDLEFARRSWTAEVPRSLP